jgi:hypothetical protein
MSDDDSVYIPEIATEGMERMLIEEEHCRKGICTDRICIWKTPGGHGFTAPNPRTVPRIRASVLRDLRQKIRKLDGRPEDAP